VHSISALCCRTGCAPSASLLPFVAVVRARAQARSMHILCVSSSVVLSSSERALSRVSSSVVLLSSERARERAQSGVLWSLSVG
jgi:hypothetical protein